MSLYRDVIKVVVVFCFFAAAICAGLYLGCGVSGILHKESAESIRAEADYTYVLRGEITMPLLQKPVKDLIANHITNKRVHYIIENNLGGYAWIPGALNDIKRRNHLIVSAEARGLVASAATEILFSSTKFIVYKDSVLIIHTGSIGEDPITVPEVFTDENVYYFFSYFDYHMNNFYYLTKYQWATYLTGASIIVKGKEFCQNNKNKLLLDSKDYCILRGLDDTRGQVENE